MQEHCGRIRDEWEQKGSIREQEESGACRPANHDQVSETRSNSL
jgi:hypothetical protein